MNKNKSKHHPKSPPFLGILMITQIIEFEFGGLKMILAQSSQRTKVKQT